MSRRCKTPELVRQERCALLIAHAAIRRRMTMAAQQTPGRFDGELMHVTARGRMAGCDRWQPLHLVEGARLSGKFLHARWRKTDSSRRTGLMSAPSSIAYSSFHAATHPNPEPHHDR